MRAFWFFVLLLIFNNTDVLHITAPKHYIFVFVGGRRNELGALSSAFGAKGEDMLECDGRLLWIYVMQDANVAVPLALDIAGLQRRQASYRMSLLETRLNFWLFLVQLQPLPSVTGFELRLTP